MKRLLLLLMLLSIAPLAAQSNEKCGNENCTCAECKCEQPKCGNPQCSCDTCKCPRTYQKTNDPAVRTRTTTNNILGWRITTTEEYDNRNGRWHHSTTRTRFHGSFIDAPWTKRDRTSIVPYVSVGYNGLVSSLDQMKLADGDRWLNVSSRSRNFRLMLIHGSCHLGQWGALRTGLELEVENLRWDENIALRRSPEGVVVPDLSYTERGIHLKKSKLVSSWFNVPLTLHITPGRRFDVYGGVVGGLRLSSYQKLKTSEFGKKHIKHENLNLRNLHFGYTAGFYYGRWGLYASYYPHSIFRSSASEPNARAVAVGLSIKTGCPGRRGHNRH